MRILLSALFILVAASPALAHKIRVFAYQEGAYIMTESRFSGGRAAQGAKVKAVANGQNITIGQTDVNGEYQFLLPSDLSINPINIDIVSQTDDGHKAHWTILAEDISPITQKITGQTPITNHSVNEQNDAPKKMAALGARVPLTENDIRTIIQEELAKGLAPINRELSEKKPNFQDILGGLGYIFGLLGIASFFTSRRK